MWVVLILLFSNGDLKQIKFGSGLPAGLDHQPVVVFSKWCFSWFCHSKAITLHNLHLLQNDALTQKWNEWKLKLTSFRSLTHGHACLLIHCKVHPRGFGTAGIWCPPHTYWTRTGFQTIYDVTNSCWSAWSLTLDFQSADECVIKQAFWWWTPHILQEHSEALLKVLEEKHISEQRGTLNPTAFKRAEHLVGNWHLKSSC